MPVTVSTHRSGPLQSVWKYWAVGWVFHPPPTFLNCSKRSPQKASVNISRFKRVNNGLCRQICVGIQGGCTKKSDTVFLIFKTGMVQKRGKYFVSNSLPKKPELSGKSIYKKNLSRNLIQPFKKTAPKPLQSSPTQRSPKRAERPARGSAVFGFD